MRGSRGGGTFEERTPVLQKKKGTQKSNIEKELGIEYQQYGFDSKFLKRCRRIYNLALPPLMSGEAALVGLLLFMIFPPMITQFLFAILPGWTMKTLVSRNLVGFLYTLCITAAVAGLDCIMGGLNFFLSLYISVRLRKRLTHILHDRYLSKRWIYYLMSEHAKLVDNPDQRIQNDVAQVTVGLVTLLCIIVSALLQITVYTCYVTYTVGWHGTLIIYIYYFFTSIINKQLMSPIVALTYNQDKLEGNFRFHHARVRTGAEAIAFTGGEEETKVSLNEDFRKALVNQTTTIFKQAYLNLFTGAIGNGNAMLGYTIAALTIFTHPEYSTYSAADLAEAITQLTSVIGGLTGSFTALVSAAPLASSLAGNASRVGQMLEFMDVMEAEEDRHTQSRMQGVAPTKLRPNELMRLDGITCRLPHGRLIVKNLDLSVEQGVNTVVQGPSGCGKTSLLRFVRGLWHLKRDEGQVATNLPLGRGGVMYLPQRPYMFAGSLQRQISYPREDPYAPELSWEDEGAGKVMELMETLDLGHLLSRADGWDTHQHWHDLLSLGEQQRLSLIRLIYHRPVLAVMDECTSALSTETEAQVYQLLKEHGITCLSVAHRPSVLAWHQQVLAFDGKGGWTLTDTDAAP
ncbi:ABC transporter transmembrane region 2-domain-containing protein [Baffinella frigidus]|nr:ABC transporter transmembrane region 2-domain-containing protein [Cryptophyta sp. CCMP2293]|mmetsp:Transcript_19423/g.46967  ORF Transcript_19423/g.46967 Transcript_19423/m.46967 type:complete len:630 (+) Transcript_19423:149-2038(+)|eukprot:CAMPEP_0180123566 /NCGR_PEP_ID=MMETSP0986-20121125/4182_1 /TAXON_ID=697907 /ORGANISM="non described non described, Strain CCMP2293" /LENGTH=629 /DNA_ID=CAMNT_0022062839 /DNA_START=75 /DNA_END=1964 /DNA_ORIENTATION=+